MIGIDISGGLGNQLFQYATAFAVAKTKNDAIRLNTFLYEDFQLQKRLGITVREFQLNKFDLNQNVIVLMLNTLIVFGVNY